MTDEPNKPNKTDAPDEPKNLYPIRPELIHEYVAQGRADLLLSLFNSIKAQRDRAESSAAIYQIEVHRLAQRLAGEGQSIAWNSSNLSSLPRAKVDESARSRLNAPPIKIAKPKPDRPKPDLDLALDI